MARAVRYPWGTEKPTTRLKAVSARLRREIDNVRNPGYHDMQHRVTSVITTCRELVDTLKHLRAKGVRTRGSSESRVPAIEVHQAMLSVTNHLRDLLKCSAITFGEHYTAFERAAESLLETTARVSRHGLSPSDDLADDNPWDEFRPRNSKN